MAVMPTDWRSGYLAQAKSDFENFNLLRNRDDVPLCQKLHYLQMATEKFAKGFLTSPGGIPHGRTHDAFRRFVQVARTRREVRMACGFTKAEPFQRYIDSLLETAGYIEDLSPEGEDHPNPEYPWQDKKGDIISPLDYDFPRLDIAANPKMLKMLDLIESCFRLTAI